MSSITVLLSAYQETLDEFESAVRSVVLQTLPPKQLIVVDDSGVAKYSLRSQSIQEKLLDPLGIDFDYVENKTNLGLVASLNLGLTRVKGEYVARMDGDDLSLPYRFQSQVPLLEQGFDVVGGGVTLFTEEGLLRNVDYPSTHLGIFYSLLMNNPIAHPVAMYKTEMILRLNGYQQVDYAEDLDLWMRVYLKGYKITNCKEVLLLRKIHAKQTSSLFSTEQMMNTVELRRVFRKSIFSIRKSI